MRLTLRTLLMATVVLLACSCAKEEDDNNSGKELLSFEAWMAKYAPQAVKMEDGLYLEWITHGTGDSLVEVGDWVRIDYTGRTLQNNVFNTRVENIARLEGTYTPYTHYVPDFVYMSDPTQTYVTMIKGQYYALLKMRKGDVVNVYMTSDFGYGAYGLDVSKVGYDGQYDLEANRPIILDNLEVVDMTTTPIEDEAKAVNDYVYENWGLSPGDTLQTGFFLQTLTPMPLERDSIPADSTVRIYYTARFLDGFVLSTNIDSVQMRLYGTITNQGPLEYTASTDSTGYILAWRVALKNMCYGDRIRMAFISSYAYDIEGRAAQYSSSSSDSSSAASSYSAYYNYLYYQNMYGYGGYNSGYYGNNYYNDYYNSMYYNSLYNSMYYNNSTTDSSSSSSEEEKITITPQVLPFTPLVYDVYVVPYKGMGGDITDSNLE